MKKLSVVAVFGALLGIIVLSAIPAGATYAGGNGRIVYASAGSGPLVTAKANGTDIRELNKTKDLNPEAPQVSADGQWVAFDDAGWSEIYKIRIDGTGVKKLTDDTDGYWWCPSWSPSGKKVIFGGDGIWTVNADGTKLKPVGSANGDCPRYSPVGGKIGYVTSGEVHIMNLDGSGDHAITSHAGVGSWIDWSPSGKKIAYKFGAEIWITNVAGTESHSIGVTDASWGPTWSPDGKQIIYTNLSGELIRVKLADLSTSAPAGTPGYDGVGWARR